MTENELDELYGVSPAGFTALRTELAAAAKHRGDAAAAKRISSARKPTTAAWIVNRLARGNRDARGRLADLGERLRAAHAAMDGERIRALSTEQRMLISELARGAFAAAEIPDPPAALREDVASTLQAVIADPEVTARFGRLTKAEHWSGFGEFGAPAEDTNNVAAQQAAREQSRAALAAAERANAAADEALREAQRGLHAAEESYQKAKQASDNAAARLTQAKARLKAIP